MSEGFGIVVNGVIGRAAKGHFYAGTGATSAGEVVDDEWQAWRRIRLVIEALHRHGPFRLVLTLPQKRRHARCQTASWSLGAETFDRRSLGQS